MRSFISPSMGQLAIARFRIKRFFDEYSSPKSFMRAVVRGGAITNRVEGRTSRVPQP